MFTFVAIISLQAGAPSPVALEDLAWFPDKGTAMRAYMAARQHRDMCKVQLQMRLSPNLPWESWLNEAERGLQCWDRLTDAQLMAAPTTRLWHLAQLYEVLGPDAYYAGAMPNPHHVYLFPVESTYRPPEQMP